jgi:hypothetical protein
MSAPPSPAVKTWFIRGAAFPPIDMAPDPLRYREITVKGRRIYHVTFLLKEQPYITPSPRGTRAPVRPRTGAPRDE